MSKLWMVTVWHIFASILPSQRIKKLKESLRVGFKSTLKIIRRRKLTFYAV